MSLDRLAEIRSHFNDKQWQAITDELGMRGTITCIEHHLVPELLQILSPPDWTLPPPQLAPLFFDPPSEELLDLCVEPPTKKS